MDFGRKRGITAVEVIIAVFIVVVVGVAAYYEGSQVTPQTETLTNTATRTTTATTTETTMPTPPAQVTVSGTVSTKGTGTSPTGISFISLTTGITYPGTISGGAYTVSLPNTQTYSVQITGKYTLTGTSSGTCGGGAIPVFIGYGEAASITDANWSC